MACYLAAHCPTERARHQTAQLCPCDNAWKNHGKYVSCTSQTAKGFLEQGLITAAESDAIISEAAKSQCGKKGKGKK